MCNKTTLFVFAVLILTPYIYYITYPDDGAIPEGHGPNPEEAKIHRLIDSNGQDSDVLDMHEVRKMLYYSWVCYCPHDLIRKWDCFWCSFDDITPLKVTATVHDATTDNFGYVGYSLEDKKIYVTFRAAMGTFRNLFNMMDFRKYSPYPDVPDVWVHQGVYNLWASTKDSIKEALSVAKDECKDCEIIVMGYSLGATVSHAAAIDLWREGERFTHINFGGLRYGNEALYNYVKELKMPVYRMTNKADPACHLGLPRHGWHHIGQEVFFNGTVYRLCDGTSEDPSCHAGTELNFMLGIDHTSYMGHTVYEGLAQKCTVFMEGMNLDERAEAEGLIKSKGSEDL